MRVGTWCQQECWGIQPARSVPAAVHDWMAVVGLDRVAGQPAIGHLGQEELSVHRVPGVDSWRVGSEAACRLPGDVVAQLLRQAPD
jgi:hypothetical protein